MFIAMDEQQNLVRAAEYTINKEYHCPACKEKLIFKKGCINQSHFSHRKNSRCHMFSEGETPEHMEGKLLLYDWFLKDNIKVHLEAFLPSLNQRPDLLIEYGGSKIAIEYQCSPISKEKINARTRGYMKDNISVIWILGDKIKVTGVMRPTHFSYLTLNLQGDFYLFQLSREGKKIEILTNLTSSQKKVNYIKKELCFNQAITEISDHLTRPRRNLKISQTTSKEQLNYLHKMSYYQHEKSRRFFELLYEHNIPTTVLPSYIFIIVPHEWMLETFPYLWKLLVLLWLETLDSHQVITRNSIERKISEWEMEREVIFHSIPNAEKNTLYLPFFEFVGTLCTKSQLKKVGEDKWVRRTPTLLK